MFLPQSIQPKFGAIHIFSPEKFKAVNTAAQQAFDADLEKQIYQPYMTYYKAELQQITGDTAVMTDSYTGLQAPDGRQIFLTDEDCSAYLRDGYWKHTQYHVATDLDSLREESEADQNARVLANIENFIESRREQGSIVTIYA